MLFAPLSEFFGQKKPLRFYHGRYIAWNTLCLVGKSSGTIVDGRCLSGFDEIVSILILGAPMVDIFKADQRGRSYAIVTFATVLSSHWTFDRGRNSKAAGWQWLFLAVSTFDSVLITLYAILTDAPCSPGTNLGRYLPSLSNVSRTLRRISSSSKDVIA
ncbi:uncharacterized protein RSE6_04727 [Rhynchosporium secalis]|uniref:Major facilitator superfamily (MFS) profile domain-containing protein n=1 Tax=Rhynchosporium secalis TaxID=38038 RepID=A0A1E1M613_RHYSE|nr:uncharacterized protein RSE6_04727 [Rhynchosporium secalis]